MKKILYIAWALFCIGITACDDNDSSSEISVLNIIESTVDFNAVGGQGFIKIENQGDTEVKAVSDVEWCKIENLSNDKITFSVVQNGELTTRAAVIKISVSGTVKQVSITQAGNKIPLVETDKVMFDAHGGAREILVESSLQIEPVIPAEAASWLSAQVDKNKLTLTAQHNYTLNKLSTTVKLKSGSLDTEITVTQTGIVLIPEKTAITMYNGGDEIKIKVNSILPFTAVSNQEWLTITPGDDFVTLTATDNSGQPARTAKVTLTSEALTATINVTQRPPIYSDYVGKWTLTGLEKGSPFTYDLSIVQATANSTYKVTGWGKSVVATDSKYAIQANFHAATGMIFITAQENLGVYSNQYDIMFYGQVEEAGKYYYVSGSGYICYIGILQRDGSVQWMNGEVEYSDGSTEEIVGARYFLKSKADGSVAGFNVDSPFMREPVMTKQVAASAAVRSVMNNGWNSMSSAKGINTPWRSYAKENGYSRLLKNK